MSVTTWFKLDIYVLHMCTPTPVIEMTFVSL